MIAYDSLLRQRVIAKNGGTHAVVQRDVTEASEFLTVMNLSLFEVARSGRVKVLHYIPCNDLAVRFQISSQVACLFIDVDDI